MCCSSFSKDRVIERKASPLDIEKDRERERDREREADRTRDSRKTDR